MILRKSLIFLIVLHLHLLHVVGSVLYVNASNSAPSVPYADWPSAATTIQDAVDIAGAGDLILVTNGVYQQGGRLLAIPATNRVAVTKAVKIQSVNGPAVTRIVGNASFTTNVNNAVRCVYLASGASLCGFTLERGNSIVHPPSTRVPAVSGGGVWCQSSSAVLSNCVLRANAAYVDGGGAYGGTLINCVVENNDAETNGAGAAYSVLVNCYLTNNRVTWYGGGAAYCALTNCLVGSNVAQFGGGAAYSTVVNCTVVRNKGAPAGTYQCQQQNTIVYYNNSFSIQPADTNYYGGTLDYCCTSPLPATGIGNFNPAGGPRFTNLTTLNLRLASNSPCINAGRNTSMISDFDLDQKSRVAGETIDVGAYEFQQPASLISYAWLQQYGITNYAAADSGDPDHDGMNNWQEWVSGTVPTNAQSVFRISSVDPQNPASVKVMWQSVPDRTYSIERSAGLDSGGSLIVLALNVPGTGNTTSYFDTNAPSSEPIFYRISTHR